jgi:MFS superfamily sulfate permease-like transporter
VIAAGAWWMAVIFLLLSASSAVVWVGKLFPPPVVRGIQIGLGLLLLRSAWSLVSVAAEGWEGSVALGNWSIPWLWVAAGLAVAALMVGLVWRPSWAGLLVIGLGLLLGLIRFGLPELQLGLTLPAPVLPSLGHFSTAFVLLVVPQIPLSLANSVFATSDAARQYFGSAGERVSPRRLLFTMGTANVAAAALGGVPVCHGSGGLTAHYRLGARTGGALLLIGGLFLLLGLLGGAGLLSLLRLIPFPALGILLAYVGVQHIFLAKDLRRVGPWSVAVLVAVLAWFTQNLALGFLGGISLYATLRLLNRNWIATKDVSRPGGS